MKLPSQAIDYQEALDQGYKPLTTAFFLPQERAMLDQVQRDLAGIDFVLVGPQTSPEVWRRNMISLTESCAVKIEYEPRGTSRPLSV